MLPAKNEKRIPKNEERKYKHQGGRGSGIRCVKVPRLKQDFVSNDTV